jgi:hypothetical protein
MKLLLAIDNSEYSAKSIKGHCQLNVLKRLDHQLTSQSTLITG